MYQPTRQDTGLCCIYIESSGFLQLRIGFVGGKNRKRWLLNLAGKRIGSARFQEQDVKDRMHVHGWQDVYKHEY